jgi:predicted nucleic acid-binding protein
LPVRNRANLSGNWQPLVDLVIADAGPLIALSRVISLSVLAELFAQVRVTQTVLAECVVRQDRPEGRDIQAAVQSGWIVVQPDVAYEDDWDLGPGEASAISAALSLRAGLLMDDRAGRRVAGDLGLPVIGVLGVLVRAKRAGKLPSIRPLVENLVTSGYFLSGKVIEDALEQAGEASP